MLDQRLRRWPNIKPALFQSVVFSGLGAGWRGAGRVHILDALVSHVTHLPPGPRDRS